MQIAEEQDVTGISSLSHAAGQGNPGKAQIGRSSPTPVSAGRLIDRGGSLASPSSCLADKLQSRAHSYLDVRR